MPYCVAVDRSAANKVWLCKRPVYPMSLLRQSGIPEDVLWRTKAMQCEGVGTDWVRQLQDMCAARVSDADFAAVSDDATREPSVYGANCADFSVVECSG